MRIHRDKKQSKSKLKKKEEIVTKSMEETKIINDKLKEENLSFLSDIDLNKKEIKNQKKEQLELSKENQKIEKLNKELGQELNIKRTKLSNINSEIDIKQTFLTNKEKDNLKKVKSMEVDFNKKESKLLKDIESKEKILEKSDSDTVLKRKEIDVLQKQKSSLYDSINIEKGTLKKAQEDIIDKTSDSKKISEKNTKLIQENVNLVSENEGLEKEKKILIKKQNLESEKLANINKEVNKKSNELDQIKESKLGLIRREEKLHTAVAKIEEYYKKAGLKIKI